MSYTAKIETSAAPDRILSVLTDPETIRAWSPVPFELDRPGDAALATGSEARVSGNLAGIRVDSTCGFTPPIPRGCA